MTLVTLAEFQRLTGISHSALGWLLMNNKLICSVDGEKGLMIDIESAQTRLLIEAIASKQDEALAAEESYYVERFARLIAQNLDDITDRAVALVLSDKQ